MLHNYLKTAYRNTLRYKGYSLINIFGLAIGMSSVLLIFLYVADEISYDRFHKNAKQIYRIGQFGNIGDLEFNGTTTPAPLANALMTDFDEVIYATRILEGINTVITYKNTSYFESSYLYADTNFFKVFTFPLLSGSLATALKEPNSMVISESTAKKYFGNKNPLGEILHEADGNNYKITGVAKDPPHTSHFHFDFLASISTFGWTSNNNWLSDSYYTYFLLQDNYPVKKFKMKLPQFASKHIGPQLKDQLGVDIKEWDKSDNNFNFYIEPLTKIYLYSKASPQIEPVSDIQTIFFFTIITIFILILAIFNFTNLTTAKSSTRAREMGMRKVLGSQRRQLVFQLLIESVFVSFMAFLLALVMVELFLPIYNNIVGKELSVKYFSRWYILPLLVFTTLLIGVLAGSYSSISISSYKILSVLRGKNRKSGNKVWLRSGLVIFQFFIAVVIIISTIVVYNQLNYLQKKELGFNKDQLLIIDRAYGIEKNGQLSFKNELLKNPSITDVTISTTAPGLDGWMGLVMKKDDDPPEDLTHFRRLACDSDFLKTFQMEMKEGSFFKEGKTTGKNYIVINETAEKSLGLEHAVGRKLVIPGKSYMNKWSYEIIGVVKDFHFSSMKNKIENLVIYSPSDYFAKYITLRIDDKNIAETIRYIEKNWKNYAINQPFNYFFVTDKLEELQKSERKTAIVFAIFSILALVIASLGLIGLASFMTERKTREIGIRKAMGASSKEIVLMLVTQFTKWILFANILAWPTAYLIMKNWQNNFAYKPDFPWWSILFASLITLIISLASVGYQTLSAAYLNPASTIRHE